MRVVTADAGVITIHMHVFGIIEFAFILIATLNLCPIECSSGGIVMDIAESEGNILALLIFDRGNNSIRISNGEFIDLGIHRSLGFAALVADETT